MPRGRPVRREDTAVEPGEATRADQDGPRRERRGVPVWLAAVVVFVALVAGVAVVLLARSTDGGGGPASVAAPATATELVLEPAGADGTDPFTASVAITETARPADATLAATPSVEGDRPGLYGGTRDQKACDPAALVEFLGANPDKAAA